MRSSFFVLFSAAILCLPACSGDASKDEGPKFSDDLGCTPGQYTCFGNKLALCAADAKAYSINPCGDTQKCNAPGGTCDPVECTNVGQSLCLNKKTTNTCQANGTFMEQPCDAGTSCAAGACRPSPCEPGESACGWKSVAECDTNGALWNETLCEGGQVCTGGACVAEVCTPGAWTCLNKTTQRVCNSAGTVVEETQCKPGEECVEKYGTCVPTLRPDSSCQEIDECVYASPYCSQDGAKNDNFLVQKPCEDAGHEWISKYLTETSCEAGEGTWLEKDCPVDTPDVVEDVKEPEPDKGPLAELEPLDIAECTIDGNTVIFKSNLTATYVEKDKDLRVSMDKALQKIEVSMKPLDEFDIGHWTSAEAGEVQVNILYNDGSDIGSAQWKYTSVDYDVELSKFEAKGGRIKGVFTGSLTSDGGVSTIPLVDCHFDVIRHD
jgi:hypothetical protein